MTSQLALDLPAAASGNGGEVLDCEPGQELLADMAAISSVIPWFGKRANTAREGVRRPLVYLYGRPVMMSDVDAKRCFDSARGLFRESRVLHREAQPQTAKDYLDYIAFQIGIASSGGGGDYWVRVTGEREGVTARNLVRRVPESDHEATWMLEIVSSLGNDAAHERADGLKDIIRRALQTIGVTGRRLGPTVMKQGGTRAFTALHLAPLVLAMRWEPAVEAAVILARHGVLPGTVAPLKIEIPRHSLEAMFARHGVLLDEPGPTKTISTVDPARTWDTLVDDAFASGQPWAERLYGIGKLQPSSSVVRALRWVSEQPR